jgi:molybdopterin-guanine dinucleotide biosynthesis protein A
VDTLLINGDPALCGEQALADRLEGFQGPLMGLYTALLSEQLSAADYLMMVPCDGPFLPDNLVAELHRQIVQADADIACLRYQGFAQPTFSLWHKRALPDIEQALLVEKNGGFKPLLQRLNALYLDWPEQNPSPFFNINTPEDLALAETLLCP